MKRPFEVWVGNEAGDDFVLHSTHETQSLAVRRGQVMWDLHHRPVLCVRRNKSRRPGAPFKNDLIAGWTDTLKNVPESSEPS